MNGDEYALPGGVYDLAGEERTDFYLKEIGPGIGPAAGTPMTFELVIVTGSAVMALTELSPDDAVRLGRWLAATAQEVKRRDAGGTA